MTIMRVLLVDDDSMLLQALSHTIALQMSTLIVESVDSAQEALKRLQEREYDTVVSDIKMPGMDGLALLKHVQERHPDTPVILITGHGDHWLAIQALRGGAYDYILKPIDREDFLAALQRALHTHRLRQQLKEQQRTLERYALSLAHLVEQRTRELEAANSAKETLLRILAQELHLPLASLKDIIQGVDPYLLGENEKQTTEFYREERSD
ncbi:MAG TPA: response regulator [Ktedonobacteraceae bacterium]|jgi:two-component system sensor histidine kinase/response regulator|nr:response regulator [Ktedonobacteraceae bacterium]